MTDASEWRLIITLNATLQAMFAKIGSAASAAMRTDAKFLIACGMQLITILVMLTRALKKPIVYALSAYTAQL